MSLQDDNPDNNNQQARHSAPASLEQVLNSLQNILEHKRFPALGEQDKNNIVTEPVPEPFSEQAAELYDDPLSPEDIDNDDINIPVLNDIISREVEKNPTQCADIESQLEQLRSELEAIVGDIMDEARQQLESGAPSPAENSMQRFLRELGQHRPD